MHGVAFEELVVLFAFHAAFFFLDRLWIFGGEVARSGLSFRRSFSAFHNDLFSHNFLPKRNESYTFLGDGSQVLLIY